MNNIDTKSILNFFSDFSLNDEESALIEKQIKRTQSYLVDTVDKLREEARLSKKSIYVRPQMMGDGLGKINKIRGKEQYNAAHVQVTRSGKVDIIPKHPSLFLGSGNFKSVRAGVELSANNQPIRITAFCSTTFNNRKEHDDIFREYRLIKRGLKKRKTENPPRVRLSKYKSRKLPKHTPPKSKLVLPYANLGDLKKCNFSSDELPQVLIEAARCVAFYHKDGVMIRDIKPENFLAHRECDGNIQVYNFDLGLATRRRDGCVVTFCGSIPYLSPEIFNTQTYSRKPYDGFKADIFALGLSLYKVKISFLPLFQASLIDSAADIYNKSKMKQVQVDYSNGWYNYNPSDNFEKLIKKMIHPDPKLRPDINTVVQRLEHIFNNFNLVQKAEIKNNKLYLKGDKKTLHDALNENHLFAYDHDGVLYVKKVFTKFKNTIGILPECDIAGAGEFHVNNGVIKAISNKNEPYPFSEKKFSKGLQKLTSQLSYSEIFQIDRVIKGSYTSDLRSIEKIIEDAK